MVWVRTVKVGADQEIELGMGKMGASHYMDMVRAGMGQDVDVIRSVSHNTGWVHMNETGQQEEVLG